MEDFKIQEPSKNAVKTAYPRWNDEKGGIKVPNETKSYLNFGIVGCGMIADIHAQALKSLAGVHLVGVADVSFAHAKSFAEKHGVFAYETYEKMLSDKTIDAICICTPSGFHAEQAKAALLAGKHTAVEKPIAMTVSDADSVIETAEKSGKLLSVISQLRFSEDVVRLKNAVLNESFGKIHFCNLSMKYWRDESYYSGSRWKGSRLLDGGILMNQGIHGIDLLRHVIGNATVISSVTDRLYHKIESPDTALALLRYDCGALGVLEATTAAFPGFDLKLEIIGEKGYAVFTEDHLTSFVIEGKEQPLASEAKSSGTASDPKAVGWKKHALQLRNFANAICGTAQLAVCGKDGRAAVALIADVYKENM